MNPQTVRTSFIFLDVQNILLCTRDLENISWHLLSDVVLVFDWNVWCHQRIGWLLAPKEMQNDDAMPISEKTEGPSAPSLSWCWISSCKYGRTQSQWSAVVIRCRHSNQLHQATSQLWEQHGRQQHILVVRPVMHQKYTMTLSNSKNALPLLKPSQTKDVRTKFFNVIGIEDSRLSPTKPTSPTSAAVNCVAQTWSHPRNQRVQKTKELLKYDRVEDRLHTSKKRKLEDPSSKRQKTKRRISFDNTVKVMPIPMRSEYSSRVKHRLWTNTTEIRQNAARNAVEFASEGWEHFALLSILISDISHKCFYQKVGTGGQLSLKRACTSALSPETEFTRSIMKTQALDSANKCHDHSLNFSSVGLQY